MFKIAILSCLLCCGASLALSQNRQPNDVSQPSSLEEVVVIAQRLPVNKMANPLSTLDHYLEKMNMINMIKRGPYAWEPFLNGMSSERSVITIDGMRIYSACTDKMDPVTSYVEITNLSQAIVHNGQSGSFGGASIAGSLDLIRRKSYFGKKEWKGSAFAGFETNNLQRILGTHFSYIKPKFFADIDMTYRGAENYKAGGGKEILYSQFTKYNTSMAVGYKFNNHQHIESSLIYDHALDVGYPALPMDISLARGVIGSVEYVWQDSSSTLQQWQTKLYYNDVTHVMDDTKRPIVPIRMDMPGWSKTVGFYSRLQGSLGKHRLNGNLSGHHNQSLAQMTMHPNNPNEKDMFMFTWPDVHTNYADIFLEDIYSFSAFWTTTMSLGMGLHHNVVNNQSGFESMQIFYPNMERNIMSLLPRLATSLQYEKDHLQYQIGISYGERAASVSEGYGFYLFNSFDRFDYIGNPHLKNERSISLSGTVAFSKPVFSAKLSGSYFYIMDYILGRPQSGLSAMTIGASGVKRYEQLSYVQLFNITVDMNYQPTEHFLCTTKLTYKRGMGENIENLPLIQPFTYFFSVSYLRKSFSVNASMSGAAEHNRFNSDFGESALPEYTILNLSLSKRFHLKEKSLLLKAGIDNVFDQSYTTFADWNRIPRMGRSFFTSMILNF